MNKLPQVFLVLMALGLGVIYGDYNFSIDRGLVSEDTAFSEHIARNFGKMVRELADEDADMEHDAPPEKKTEDWHHETEEPDLSDREWDASPPDDKTFEYPKDDKPAPELNFDEVDFLTKLAASYLNIAMADLKLRNEYAQKTLKCTAEAMDIIEEMQKEHPDNPEVEERLKNISKLRHDAVKLDPASD